MLLVFIIQPSSIALDVSSVLHNILIFILFALKYFLTISFWNKATSFKIKKKKKNTALLQGETLCSSF